MPGFGGGTVGGSGSSAVDVGPGIFPRRYRVRTSRMAALPCTFSPGAITLATATTKTLIQLTAPTNQRLRVTSFMVSITGGASTDSNVRVRLLRQTTAGTMTAGTEVKLDDSLPETPQAAVTYNATAEPTAGDVIKDLVCSPQGGVIRVPLYSECQVKGGGRIGIDVTSGTLANSVTVYSTIDWEE